MDLNIQKRLSRKREEKGLLKGLKNKDKEAFIRAYDLCIDQIYRFIYFKVGKSEEAQDLTSAVFLKAWNHIQSNSLENEKTLRPLFYKIARTSVIDYYRKNNHTGHNVSIDDEENGVDVPDEKNDLAKQMETAFDMELVQKKLTELKDEYREVIVLKFIDELSVAEIAEVVNKSKGSVRVLTHRALNALRDLMEKNK